MEKGKRRPAWPLGEHLLSKSFELAFEDPATAIRFAKLGLALASLLEGGYDPFSRPVKPKRSGIKRGKKRKRRS